MTKIIDFKNNIDINILKDIGKSIRDGNLVIFPTETVYGIGANALNSTAVDNIFIAKGRAQDNPLITHISNFDMLKDLVEEPNDIEKLLIDAFMPGPFTLILKKKSIIPDNVTCGLDTVGIRFPNNNIARMLIEESGVPIAAPSANISSRPSGTNIEDIKDEFMNKVDYIIDGGESLIGVESTVCKVIDGIPTILRPGKITPDDITKVVGVCKLDSHIFGNVSSNEKVESPGMKYKHYAPNTKAILVYSENEKDLINLVKDNIIDNTLIIGKESHKDLYNTKYLSYGNTLEDISHNIFKLLREADKLDANLIIIEGVKKEGLGIAIMNRLLRSVSFNYIEK